MYRAWCEQIKDEVAIKVVELEWLQAPLEDIGREIQVMSLSSHPNVVPFSTAFVEGTDLWIVMPLLTGGSVLSLMNCVFREGLPEDYARYVLWCVLKALEYFHGNGQMHRDVKAANLLLDSNGNTMLADYGMMGWMVEGGWDRKQRQTFVGTPCWMAPEVMEQTDGYDYKADIWSLGITAIELAQGRAPYTNYPPMKVLFLTLQNPPPTLAGSAEDHFSAKYKDFIATCLQKDPKVRPSAKQLLKHPLFVGGVAKPTALADIIAKLPPIGSRGGSQKQLFRQLQKVAVPQRSGIYDLSAKGLGWDFGDEPESQQSSESVAAPESNPASSTPQASPPNSSSASVSSDAAPQTVTNEINAVPDVQPMRNVARASPDVGLVPESASTPNLSAQAAQHADGGMHARALSMPVIPPQTVSMPPGPSTSPSVIPDNVSIVGTQANASWISAVPAKTVGQLRKGRFTVSDVPNPDKSDGKIDSFLDGDSSDPPSGQASGPRDEGRTLASMASAALPQSVLDRKPSIPDPPQSSLPTVNQSQNTQPTVIRGSMLSDALGDGREAASSIPPSTLPQAVVDSKPRTSGGRQPSVTQGTTSHPRIVNVARSAPSYAAAVSGSAAKERTFISGVAPVVIKGDARPAQTPRSQPPPSTSEIMNQPLSAVRLSTNQQATPVRPVGNQGVGQMHATTAQPGTDSSRMPGSAAQGPVVIPPVPPSQSASSGNQRVRGTSGDRTDGAADFSLPNTSAAASLSTAPVPKPAPNIPTPPVPNQVPSTASSSFPVTTIPSKPMTNGSSQTHIAANPPPKAPVLIRSLPVNTSTASVPQSPNVATTHGTAQSIPSAPPKRKSRFEVKDVGPVPGSKPAVPLSIPTATSTESINSLSSGTLPPVSAGSAAPSVPKTKSRFEVKDIDQRLRQPTLANGTPPIVSIGPPSTNSSVSGSRQGTPLVSPQAESVPNSTPGTARLSLSLLGELHNTIHALVNENETLRREVAMLRGKTQTLPENGGITGNRSLSANEVSARSSPMHRSTPVNSLHHTHSANSILTDLNTPGQQIGQTVQHSQPRQILTQSMHPLPQPQPQPKAHAQHTQKQTTAHVQADGRQQQAQTPAHQGAQIPGDSQLRDGVVARHDAHIRETLVPTTVPVRHVPQKAQEYAYYQQMNTAVPYEQRPADVQKQRVHNVSNVVGINGGARQPDGVLQPLSSLMGHANGTDGAKGTLPYSAALLTHTASGQMGHSGVTSRDGAVQPQGRYAELQTAQVGSMTSVAASSGGGDILARTSPHGGDVESGGGFGYGSGMGSIGLQQVAAQSQAVRSPMGAGNASMQAAQSRITEGLPPTYAVGSYGATLAAAMNSSDGARGVIAQRGVEQSASQNGVEGETYFPGQQ